MPEESNSYKEILAVLVIYKVEPEKSSTYKSLEAALKVANAKMDLLIYDNSPIIQVQPTSDYWNINYENDSGNGGVSKAYNRGFELAKKNGKRWLWLLDQDDKFDERCVLQYDSALKNYRDEDIFVPKVIDEKSQVSPFQFRLGGGWRIREADPGIFPLHKFFFINAGALISLEAFQRASGYSNEFPLDFSDIDFILKLRKEYSRFVVVSTIVEHQLSGSSHESKEKTLNRFNTYQKAARLFRKKYSKKIKFVQTRTFFRAVKLSINFRSWQFINEFFSRVSI